MSLKDNPFAKVFPSIEAAETYAQKVKEAGRTVFLEDIELESAENLQGKDLTINLIVEEVFNFTLCQNPPSIIKGTESHLLCLKDVSGSGKLSFDDVDSLELVLFERLLLEDPTSCHIISNKKKTVVPNSHVVETKCLCYLYECYQRIIHKKHQHKDFLEVLSKMTGFIIRNAATALKQPEVYEKQNLFMQVLELCTDIEVASFLSEVADEIEREEGAEHVFTAFSPVLALVQEDLEKLVILNISSSMLRALHVYAFVPKLALVLLKQGKHREDNSLGKSFSESALGAAFNISMLPKNPYLQYEFFDKPLDVNLKLLEDRLWVATEGLVDDLHKIVIALLKSCRHETLAWIGACLDKNVPRSRLSALNMFSLDALSCVSDGFMLNLASVLLRLAEPFVAELNNPKLLRVDPTYPAAKLTPDGENGVHSSSFAGETCLLPTEEGQSRPCAKQFNFITECFYLTHRALSLGPGQIRDKAQRLYQEIGMMQAQLPPEARSDDMELAMSKYLSLRCAVNEPTTKQLESQFITATCSWLVQVVVDPDTRDDRESFNPTQFREVTFPLPAISPPTLRSVPEILLENVHHFLVAAKRFQINGESQVNTESLGPILTHLLVFMSGSARARNPHLRAQMAECLECLLPREKTSGLDTFVLEKLFKDHPHRGFIVECLLDVFVGIEMTGQSVSFEQKFNYRRPMYTVMEYLWNIEEQRQCFKDLAAHAEANMEAVNPPLFLRFLNLLMNDAVFLLDEALSNMAQIRTLSTAREEGEWENLPPHERQRNETSLVHIGMTARFDNILGMKTIECLVYLSSEIKSIFCHSTMVDRIAAMLNYFLLHLVGPNKKNFKVKDPQKDYHFEPATIVKNICRIYIQLRDSEEFCAAVSRDGRSYSPQLFVLAENVLARIIGGGIYITDLQEVAAKVNRLADLQKREDEILADIPDEYLDPIMSTLMTDPVILPSSRQIVDRSTIARHLLSDQSDPFNREPLTMDMVKSATELKQQIEEWVSQRHEKAT